MKKKEIFTIAAASVAALFLVCVAIIGIKNNFFGIASLRGDTANISADTNAAVEKYEYTWDTTEYTVYGLEVNWVGGPVNIVVVNGDTVRITETSATRLEEKDRLKLSRSDGLLKIDWKDELFTFGFMQSMTKSLVIELPETLASGMTELNCTNVSGNITATDLTAEEIKISSTSGDLLLSGIVGEEAKLSTVSGEISLNGADISEKFKASTTSGDMLLENINTQKADISTTSGTVSCLGACNELETDSVSGAVSVQLSNAPKDVEMKSVSGGVKLMLPQSCGFDAEYSSVSGEFNTDFPVSGSMGAKSGRILCSGGDVRVRFETTSGNMEILKN